MNEKKVHIQCEFVSTKWKTIEKIFYAANPSISNLNQTESNWNSIKSSTINKVKRNRKKHLCVKFVIYLKEEEEKTDIKFKIKINSISIWNHTNLIWQIQKKNYWNSFHNHDCRWANSFCMQHIIIIIACTVMLQINCFLFLLIFFFIAWIKFFALFLFVCLLLRSKSILVEKHF